MCFASHQVGWNIKCERFLEKTLTGNYVMIVYFYYIKWPENEAVYSTVAAELYTSVEHRSNKDINKKWVS